MCGAGIDAEKLGVYYQPKSLPAAIYQKFPRDIMFMDRGATFRVPQGKSAEEIKEQRLFNAAQPRAVVKLRLDGLIKVWTGMTDADTTSSTRVAV